MTDESIERRVITADDLTFYSHPEYLHDVREAEYVQRRAVRATFGVDLTDPATPRKCAECGEMTSAERPGYLDWKFHEDCFKARELRALGGP